ncbi:oligosaccharide flippase family protein [Marinobacter sp.]|uniref:oligosaccharide flippase family protein n=1 Tax=Marinobacter sp. TaxID=50741 RepID=UPI0025BE552F|nr:oligosaccharide flippase family protein [Marinobacter sp.]
MSGVKQAILYSSLGRYLLMAIGLASSMITARLLSPEEIGTFAIASSVVVIMAEFRMLGANTYLVRQAKVTTESIRSAYGLTILISWGLGVALAAISWPLEGFFGVDGLGVIFLILSFSFLLAPYISIPDALLTRDYRFREIVIINITSSVIQLVLVVVLIKQGFSFYSLAIGQAISILVKFVMSLYFTRHVRVYMPSFSGIKDIAKLGVFTSASHVIRNSQQTFPDMLIGKLGNPTQVGIFSRGLGFTMFISTLLLSGISPVALPYFSEIKNKGKDVVAAYRHASELIAGVVWPVLAVASVASLPAIRLMFGDQWDQAAPIATVAAFWAILRSAHVMAPNALVAVGKEGSMLVKEVIVFTVFLLVTSIAYHQAGLMGVAYAFVFAGLAEFLISSWFMKYKVGVGFLPYCIGMSSSVVVALVCWATTKALDWYMPFEDTSPVVVLIYIIVILPPVWLASIHFLKHPLREQVEAIFRRLLVKS